MKKLLSVVLALALTMSAIPRGHAAASVYGRTVAAGYDHFLAVSSDGVLWSWGWNTFGQLGTGTGVESLTPARVLDGVVQARASDYYSAAITADGYLWMWGSNAFGQLGDGTGEDRDRPVRVLDKVTNMYLAPTFVFALRQDGSLWGWGSNASGQLGTGDYRDRSRPVMIKDSVNWTETVANLTSAAASRGEIRAGALWTWGANDVGQLGNGTLQNTPDARAVIAADVTSFDIGSSQGIALGTDGQIWCWGSVGSGILGDGGLKGSSVPVQISATAAQPGDAYTGAVPDEIAVASDWARDHIIQAISRGLVPPALHGDYRSNITRAEFCSQAVTFLEVRTGKTLEDILSERGIYTDASPFTDTGNRIITAAYKLGIVAGMGDGTFNPDGQITREQAAVMLRNTAVALGYPVNAPKNSFPDSASIAQWALDAVNFVADRNVMAGTGSGFAPKEKYSREMADITFNLLYEATAG